MDVSAWNPEFWTANEAECKKTLMDPENWNKVPLLSDNETPVGTLVRFKGMIQDMLNPEYFAKDFKVTNLVTNETRICQGKYHTAVINEATEAVEIGDEMLERQIIACIPIPGLNEWAKAMSHSNNQTEASLEGNINKRIRLDPNCQKYSKEVFVFVYPEELESSQLKVNNIIEVIGFLDRRSINEIDEDQEGQSKERHCIHTVQFKFCPELYPNSEINYDCIWREASTLLSELKLILTSALLGDDLAADYLIFHLISTVYNRQHNLVPGKLSLNIRGIPKNGKNYTKELYSLISHLVVKSEYLPITIDNMNKMNMIPRKCYNTNRLLNGYLQLSDRTHLVLDETDLQPGKLDSKGMINIQGLKDVITNQQIKYDFTYYSIDYETQIPVLILSEGKSLFPCDIDVVLTPDVSCSYDIDNILTTAMNYINSQSLLLEKLRQYIATISTVSFNFNEDILKVIENDYVNMRKADAKNVSAEDLHRLMMISKLIALSSGKNELDHQVWEKCKKLEILRKSRNN